MLGNDAAMMIAPQQFNNMVMGKTVSEARASLNQVGYTIQVASEDGVHKMLTADWSTTRLRVDVVDGKVVGWTIG